MNLPPVVFLFLVAVLILAAAAWPRLLFFAWPVVLVLLPTHRLLVLGAPLYLHTVATTIFVIQAVARRGYWRWPSSIPPWHWFFLFAGFGFGCLVPLVRYGAIAESVYIFWQHGAAWLGFCMGVVVFGSWPRVADQRAFGFGWLTGAIGLAILAVSQRGNIGAAHRIQTFYHKDVRPRDLLMYDSVVGDDYLTDFYLQRAFAPFQTATTLSGVAVIVGIAVWLAFRDRHRTLGYVGVAASGVTVAMTVSRHALLVVLAGAAVAVLLGSVRVKLSAGVLAFGSLLYFLGSPDAAVVNTWESRFSVWEAGVMEDRSVAARLIDGPLRLANYLTDEPAAIFLGSGLDPAKLSLYGAAVDAETIKGFASNGFLLYLYGMGIVGFAVFLAFWLWLVRRMGRLTGSLRAIALPCAIMLMLLLAADNYCYMDKVAASTLYLVAGMLASLGLEPASARLPASA